MQGPDNGGLDDAITAQEHRKAEALHALMDADAELDRLREQQRLQDMTPEQRRRRWRVIRGGATLAGAGVILIARHALDAVRDHPRAAVGALVASAGLTMQGAPTVGDGEIREAEPPRAVRVVPPDRIIDVAPNGDSPTPGLVDLEVESDAPSTVEPPPASGDAVAPGPTASPPNEPPAPDPTRTPGPEPPETSPSPPPSPSPTPEPPEPEPEPSPTPTVAPPPEPPTPPADEPLLCADLEYVLDACVDVPLVDELLGGLL